MTDDEIVERAIVIMAIEDYRIKDLRIQRDCLAARLKVLTEAKNKLESLRDKLNAAKEK